MGYLSDIRIRLKKKDFDTLVEKFEEERAKCKLERAKYEELIKQETDEEKIQQLRHKMHIADCMADLFDKDTTYRGYDGQVFEKKYKDLSVCREEKTTVYERIGDTDGFTEEVYDTVYFGWNGLKWYDGFKDVDFVMEFIESLDYYAYARIGEEMGDTEQREDGFDCIGFYTGFDDDFN
jgi:hypothetical protein